MTTDSRPSKPNTHRAAALRYVRELLARGYTPERGEAETFIGRGSPGEPGYDIRHGVIRVPMLTGEEFRFRTLAEVIAAGQQELFV